MRVTTMLAGLALAGCQESSLPADAQDCETLKAFLPTMAISDARAAWRRNDRHILGVYGITTLFPGMENPSLPVRMIEGTSDSDCPAWNYRTMQYARVYNQEMQRLVEQSTR